MVTFQSAHSTTAIMIVNYNKMEFMGIQRRKSWISD